MTVGGEGCRDVRFELCGNMHVCYTVTVMLFNICAET